MGTLANIETPLTPFVALNRRSENAINTANASTFFDPPGNTPKKPQAKPNKRKRGRADDDEQPKPKRVQKVRV